MEPYQTTDFRPQHRWPRLYHHPRPESLTGAVIRTGKREAGTCVVAEGALLALFSLSVVPAALTDSSTHIATGHIDRNVETTDVRMIVAVAGWTERKRAQN